MIATSIFGTAAIVIALLVAVPVYTYIIVKLAVVAYYNARDLATRERSRKPHQE